MKPHPTAAAIASTIIFSLGILAYYGSLHDPHSITINHSDGTKTRMDCKTGSGIVTCKHSDIRLTALP